MDLAILVRDNITKIIVEQNRNGIKKSNDIMMSYSFAVLRVIDVDDVISSGDLV